MRRRPLLIPMFFFVAGLALYAVLQSPAGGWLEEALVTPLVLTETAMAAVRESAPKLERASERERQLAEQVDDLHVKAEAAEELRRENARLRAALGAQRGSTLPTVGADVIGRSASNALTTVTINRGRTQGVSTSSAVFTPAGLIGRVYRVRRSSAEVLLVSDPTSGVGAMDQRSRDVGVVKGLRGMHLLFTYLPTGADVRAGDEIVTSGMGGVLPKGIPIGTVMQVRQDPQNLSWSALVWPLANVDRVEQVLVVVGGERR